MQLGANNPKKITLIMLDNLFTTFILNFYPMGDSSQFSPLTTLSEQLGPNSWVSSVFIPAFIANIGKHFFLKYDSEYSKSI